MPIDDLSPVASGHIRCLDTHNLAGTTKEGLKNWLIVMDPMQLLKNYLLFMHM